MTTFKKWTCIYTITITAKFLKAKTKIGICNMCKNCIEHIARSQIVFNLQLKDFLQ